jgi:hypothetical protein
MQVAIGVHVLEGKVFISYLSTQLGCAAHSE